MAILKDQSLWDAYVAKQGYVERTITKSDPETSLYDVTVSTARSSDGRLQLDADFFVWTCPITSFGRIVNGFIPRLKLYDQNGTELGESAMVLFKIQTSLQARGVIFAQVPYGNFKRLSLAEQMDSMKNVACAITFDMKDSSGRPIDFLDVGPGWSIVLAITGTSQQVDKDQNNFVVEIDIGLRTQ